MQTPATNTKIEINGQMIQLFINVLFLNMTKIHKTMIVLIRDMALLLLIKVMVEDLKIFLNKFNFMSTTKFKYLYQCITHSTLEYNCRRFGNKWLYIDNNSISFVTLSTVLENKSIFINQPGIYYYNYDTYIIKIIVTLENILFVIPKIDFIKQYLETNIINKNRDIIYEDMLQK